MGLSVAPLPWIFWFFIIMPVVFVVVLVAGIFVYFWFVKEKPKLVMFGAVVLVFYGLAATYVGSEFNARDTYFVEVDLCDVGSKKLEGWIVQDGQQGSEVRFRFPSFSGSGHSSLGDAPTVQTFNFQTNDWMDLSADGVCSVIAEQRYVGLTTNGFKTIQFVKFFDPVGDDPLEYSIAEDMLVQKDVSFASGWFSDVYREDVSQEVLDRCSSLASKYESVRQIDYAFAAEVARLTAEGRDPFDFAWRAHVLPNLSGFQTIEEVVSDFDSCLHEQHINSWPILVSDAWIVFEDQCEGVFDGCMPAREQVPGTLSLKE